MNAENDDRAAYFEWNLDPFKELYKVWSAINEGTKLGGVPHIVGRAKVTSRKVQDVEMDVILHSRREEVSFREGDYVYFVVAVTPEEGIEGAYMRLHKILGGKK